MRGLPGIENTMEHIEKCRLEFRRNREEAAAILDRTSEEDFAWRPAPGVWSVADNLIHMAVTGRLYWGSIGESTREGRAQGWLATESFRCGPFERVLVWAIGPPVRVVKVKAPRLALPTPRESKAEVVVELMELEAGWNRCLEEARGLDWKRTKIPSPFSSKIRISLGAAFAINAAHERRHLWQARNVLSHPAFPGARALRVP